MLTALKRCDRIIDALAREIAAGRAGWDETFAVSPGLRSDPTGEVYALRDEARNEAAECSLQSD